MEGRVCFLSVAYTIFFSWQSDTPTECGRNSIERALTEAKDQLTEDLTVEAALRGTGFALDQDTRGVAGAERPDHMDTILLSRFPDEAR
jgi:hypothetical protein